MKRWVINHWPLIGRILPFAVLYGLMLFIAVMRLDLDYGWHFRSGEHIWSHGVPHRDLFTYTAPDFDWVNHEWLNDVIVYPIQHWLGWYALAAMFAGLWLAAVGLITRWRLSWPVMVLTFFALAPYMGIRAVTWSALLFAVLYRLLTDKPQRPGWLVVLVLCLWANLHGGVVVGLGLVGLMALNQRSWKLAAWGAAGALATIANPYGWHLYVEIARTLGDVELHARITEWAPLELTWLNGAYATMAVVAIIFVAKPVERVLGGVFLLGSLFSNRHVPFLVLATVPVIERAYGQALIWLQTHRPRWRRGVVIGGAVVAIAAIMWAFGGPSEDAADRVDYPAAAVADLKRQPCAGRLFNEYSYGGYLINNLPGQLVYIDGRMPSWSGPEGSYFARWMKVLSDPAYTTSEFERYGIACALVQNDRKEIIKWLEERHWQITAHDMGLALWRRPN